MVIHWLLRLSVYEKGISFLMNRLDKKELGLGVTSFKETTLMYFVISKSNPKRKMNHDVDRTCKYLTALTSAKYFLVKSCNVVDFIRNPG